MHNFFFLPPNALTLSDKAHFTQGMKLKRQLLRDQSDPKAADPKGMRLRADFNVYTIHKSQAGNPTMIRAM